MIYFEDNLLSSLVPHPEESSSSDRDRGYTAIAQGPFLITVSTNILGSINVLIDEDAIEAGSQAFIDFAHQSLEERRQGLGDDDVTRVSVPFALI